MKNLYHIPRIVYVIVFISFLLPNTGLAQKAELEVELFVSCVEDLGNDTLVAYFGYENPNEETITVQDKKSYIAYNYTRDEKYVIATFEPGVHDKVFSQEFRSDDWVRWTVKFSNYTKEVRADSTSSVCVGELPIIPGYQPPAGGKQYQSKIGAELTSLYNAYIFDPANFEGATDFIFQLEGTKVLIEVYAYDGQYAGMINSLDSLGFDQVSAKPGQNYTTGWVEIADLLKLNGFADLFYARPVYPGVPNYIVPPTGVTKSQGDFAMHSDFARLGYQIDGSGVKIGVLSNSFNSKGLAHVDVKNGDLPGSTNPRGFSNEVQVFKDIAPNPTPLSDEGRAMLQIVHDIAPGAQLGFRTGFLGELDMALGIREMADSGYHVIVDDLSYITEPFFRDGIISQTIDSVVSEGVTFFSSAGNFGKSAYSGMYTPATAPPSITGDAHNFAYLTGGSPDIFQGIELPPGSYMMVLQWDDGSDPTMNTTSTDLDLFLSDDAGFARLGFNRENIGGFPIEVVPFSVAGDTVISNILITRAGGPNVPVRFKYMLFRGGSQFKMLEYGDQGNSTIVGHPNAAGAISVGAVRFDKNPVYSPGLYPVPVIMSFSSVGGTPVNGEVRAKPDITAPNGVNTTVDLGNGDWDDPIDPDTLFPNFFGTSAASPHAAGVAALIIEAKAKFDLDSSVTPDQIRTLMKSTAIDMDDPGEDLISGSGFIQAHKALMTFAQPTPYIENLINITDSLLVGDSIVPFTFTIKGDFFTDSTQILFRGEALESGVVVTDEHTIEVSHPGFLGNPEVQAYNPETSTSELDGGYSNVKLFSDSVRQNIIITANNTNKKYGEVLPGFTAHIELVTVDGDTMALDTAVNRGLVLQAEAERLSGLSYTTTATESADASIYTITPSLNPPLDLDSIPNEVDFAISEKYILDFVNGNLVVEKLALTITPKDTSLVYGQFLPEGGFQFLYQIGDSSVVITNPDSILQSVQQEHLGALTNEIALVRGVALVNGIPVVRGAALVNGVPLLRGTALVNGVEVEVEVLNGDTTVYVAGDTVVNEGALVNGGTLVRGVALVNNRPFVNMTEIVRGVALVNGAELNFDGGYMSLGGDPLVNGIPVQRGVALVNGLNTRGLALVNGNTVEVDLNGVTTINSIPVPVDGLALVNDIPVLRGAALVNSSLISRGAALVNGVQVVIENGSPTGRGIALVNGSTSLRGIALVNGLPLIKGTALVNNLEVFVDDGEVTNVLENGGLVTNGYNLSRGLALVNGVALVNGGQLRGTALVNGIALTDEGGDGDELVNLANMNFMASSAALANGLNSLRGTALVNGLDSEDGEALKTAAGTVQEDGSIVFENGFTSRGVALVNGLNYVRGTALVNNSPLSVRGTALVNSSTINGNSNSGTILVFDATELGDTTDNNVGFTPISFITGTTVGKHWIVPGTYISNNYDISYGLGTLSIEPAPLTISAVDNSKVFGEEDPLLSYSSSGLLGQDTLSGQLIRDPGEDVDAYGIRQGSVTAGEDYTISYDSAVFTILPAPMSISISADDKVYDGTRTATVSLSDDRLVGSELDITYTSALFDNRNVGDAKEVTVLGLALSGADAGNYEANTEATATADITADSIEVRAVTDSRTYNGTTASDGVPEVDLLQDGDVVAEAPSQSFETRHAGSEKVLIASGLLISDGNGGNNYVVSYVNDSTGNIEPLGVTVTAVSDSRTYDGSGNSDVSPYYDPLSILDEVSTEPVQVFDSEHAGPGKTLTASGMVINDGNEGGNYAISYVEVTDGNIDRLGVTVTAATDRKPYDGTANSNLSPTYDVAGILDEVTVEPNQVFNNEHAGPAKTLIASGMVINDGNEGNNYDIRYVDATDGIIDPLGVTVTAVTDSRAYDGSTDSDGIPGYDASSLFDAVSTEPVQVFDSRNAGTGKTLIASGLVINDGNDGNNYDIRYVDATDGIIDPLGVTVTAVTDSRTYNGTTESAGIPVYDASGLFDAVSTEPVQVFNSKHAGTGKTLIASGLLINDGNEGGNYSISYVDATGGNIDPLSISVTAVSDSKDYDGGVASAARPHVEALMSGDAIVTDPVQVFDNPNAGTGKTLSASGLQIDDANGGNNYLISYVDDPTGVIRPRPVTVSPVDTFLYINEGDALPIFAFIYNGWISGDAGNEGYTVLRDSDGAVYDQSSSESAGSYTVTPTPSNGNYSFFYETGTLHVNPYGPGTRSVKPVLNCIREIDTDYYMANFEYRNDNDAAVYIPLGEDNFLTGTGIDWVASDSIPTMFAAGGGNFRIYFDGVSLTWTLSSRDEDQKVSNAANANSSSTKCRGNIKSTGLVAESGDVHELDLEKLVAYPNPVVDKVYLSLKGIENYETIRLFDFAGRSFPISSIDKQTDRLEIDMAELPAGHYLISVVMEDQSRVVQLIKR